MEKRDVGLTGVFLIEGQAVVDSRGFFARLHSRSTLASWGVSEDFVETSVSYNELAGTLRGLHFQRAPHQEAKLVWCPSGAVYDVVVDLRPDSDTYRSWRAVELSDAKVCLYVPLGVAHGFQTLSPGTLVHYQISNVYDRESATGIRYDDAELRIPWPIQPPTRLSERDRALPSLAETLSRREFAASSKVP